MTLPRWEWAAVLDIWSTVEADFQLHHHVDLVDDAVLHDRSWRWFTVRLMGLPDTSRTWRALQQHYRGTAQDLDDLDDADADLGVARPV